jgi:hypothetical protein
LVVVVAVGGVGGADAGNVDTTVGVGVVAEMVVVAVVVAATADDDNEDENNAFVSPECDTTKR